MAKRCEEKYENHAKSVTKAKNTVGGESYLPEKTDRSVMDSVARNGEGTCLRVCEKKLRGKQKKGWQKIRWQKV